MADFIIGFLSFAAVFAACYSAGYAVTRVKISKKRRAAPKPQPAPAAEPTKVYYVSPPPKPKKKQKKKLSVPKAVLAPKGTYVITGADNCKQKESLPKSGKTAGKCDNAGIDDMPDISPPSRPLPTTSRGDKTSAGRR